MRKPVGGGRLSFIPPMPKLFKTPPKGKDWIHEVKQDGYRTQIIRDRDGIRLFTKRGYDWTGVFEELAAEAIAVAAGSFILEGETIKSTLPALPTSMRSRKRKAQARPGTSTWSHLICFISTEPAERRHDEPFADNRFQPIGFSRAPAGQGRRQLGGD